MRSYTTALIIATLVMMSAETWAAAARPVVIVTPAGGEFYVIGSQQRVRLDPKTKAKSITLELSRDGGTTFSALGTIDNLVKDKNLRNVFTFTVTAPASGQCVIRATADGVSSTSSGFTIGNAAAATVTASQITTDQISSGEAPAGNVLGSDGNGGTTFTPVTVNSGQITSGAASSGNVLVSDGSGGSSFQSLNGTFVRVAGDNMTGALNVAGNVGVGTTTPRGELDVAHPTQADFVLAGSATNFMRTSATSSSLIHSAEFGGGIEPYIIVDLTDRSVFLSAANSIAGSISLRSTGAVNITGAPSLSAITRTTDFTADDSVCGIFCNTAGNDITITLPTAVGRTGRIYFIKKISASNSMNIATTGGQTIDGALGLTLTTNNSLRLLMSNGTNWFVISSQ